MQDEKDEEQESTVANQLVADADVEAKDLQQQQAEQEGQGPDEDMKDAIDEKKEVAEKENRLKEEKHNEAVLAYFDSLCRKIEKNDEKFRIYSFELLLNDDMAIKLGRALNGNTHLYFLRIMVGHEMTVRGSRALLGGLLGSEVKYPAIQVGEGVLPLEMAPLYMHPLRTVEQICLSFSMDDATAAKVGEALKTAESLVVFGFQVQDMSPRGAQLLAEGIRSGRKIKELVISLRPGETVAFPTEVMRVLMVDGVQGSSIQTISLKRILGDMNNLVLVLSNLRKLELKDMTIDDDMAELLGAALTKNKSVESLTIPVQNMSNLAAQRLADGTRTSRSIQNLELSLSEGENAATETMKTWLLQGVYGARAIQKLTLSGTVGDLATLELVLPSLHALAIQDVVLSVDDTDKLSRAVVKTKKLHSLSLNECGLTRDHMHVLTSMLMTHEPLKNVDVSRNQIGDYGIAAMILNFSKDWVKDQSWNYQHNGTLFDR